MPPSAYGPLPRPERALVLQNGTVFDGREVHTGFDVVIEGDTLICVAASCPVPDGAEVWDATDAFVMPGLIDAHVHWIVAEYGLWSFSSGSPQIRRDYLEAGITTVRSLGDTPDRLMVLRERAFNDFAGPRFIAAGPIFTAPGGHPMNNWKGLPSYVTDAAIEVDDVAEAQRQAEYLLNGISNGIKVVYTNGSTGQLPRMKRDVLQRLVEVAHAHNTWIAVHVSDDSEVRTAAALGADTIEHGFVWDAPTPETLDVLIGSRSIVVPTLGVAEHFEKQPI